MRPEEICSRYNSSIVVRRWAATWLDFLLFVGIFFAMTALGGEKYGGVTATVSLVLIVLYYPLLEGLTGKTFGKWICRLKIVDASGNRPGVLRALVRTLFRLVEVNPVYYAFAAQTRHLILSR